MQPALTTLQHLRFVDDGPMVAAVAQTAGPGLGIVSALILLLLAGWRYGRRLATGEYE